MLLGLSGREGSEEAMVSASTSSSHVLRKKIMFPLSR